MPSMMRRTAQFVVLVALLAISATEAGALEVCDVGPNVCPTDYHVTEYRCEPAKCFDACTYENGYNNLTVCQVDAGPQFTKCFECHPGCPNRWSWSGATTTASCDAGPIGLCFGPYLSGNQVTCSAPKPVFYFEGGEGSGCGDLGATHLSPYFLVKYTVKARPGSQVWKYNRRPNCGGSWSLAPESPLTIPSSGTLEYTIQNTASTNCSDGALGAWESFVRVDNVDSDVDGFTYFNSNCSSTLTCTKAASHCP